jgi:hypothetical protein
MIAYLDCSTGISGDKFLGALVDAGFDPDRLTAALADLGLSGIDVSWDRRSSHGVTGVGIAVTEPGAPRRHWRELRSMLEGATLQDAVRDGALGALEALARAEAHVHGVDVDSVHFHEIGAADTLTDILGVALGLHDLGVETLVASPVAVGSGTVMCEHGELPVPAPATARLLEGVPVVPGTAPGELTTPTGAALLGAFVDDFGSMPTMTMRRSGIGCGTRDLGQPNISRLILGEPLAALQGHDRVIVLDTNLDHLTPEEIATAAAHLLDAGALDVWQTPVVMKKGRAATVLSVLAGDTDAPRLAERMIAETGTLGVRITPAERRLVERDVTEIVTSLGTARFKVARLPDGTRTLRAESDDVARISAERGLAADAAARILETEAARKTGVQPMRQRPSSEMTNPSD